MRVKRLLTVALMALVCAGTATAASQLNSVQVTPKDNLAVLNLHTTGAFTHKEYRADDHLVLVDLSGVTADASVQRSATLSSSVLKSYKLTSYVSASGADVTRVELVVGDNVSLQVSEQPGGLQISLLTPGAKAPIVIPPPAIVTAPVVASSPSTPPVGKPAPAYAQPIVHSPAQTTQPAPIVASASPAPAPKLAPLPAPVSTPELPSNAPRTIIRAIGLEHTRDSVNITISGPASAEPFVLTNPDRIVVDFGNTVVHPGVKGFPVKGKDVLDVRVARHQLEPPVTRLVVDLGAPHSYEVVKGVGKITLKINKAAEVAEAAPAPMSAPAPKPQPQPAAKPSAHMEMEAKNTPPPPPAASPAKSPAASPAAKPIATTVVSYSASPAAQPVASPAAQTSVIPTVKAIQERIADSSDKVDGQDSSASRPVPAEVRPPSDPGQRAGQAAGTLAGTPVSLLTSANAPSNRYTGEPISVNLKDVDLKDFFRLIHEISGLNIVLDPNVHGAVTIVLDDVPWDQALDIVLKNSQLDRELQGNVLRIAATESLRKEAVDRRAQSEAVALAVDRQTVVRTLSYAKALQALPTVKKFLSARGDVIADERTNSLIISDIPSVLPILEKMLTQLDRRSQQVEIEVRVVSATRSFSRDLGVQLGFNWGNGVTTLGGSNPNGTSSSITSSGSGTSTGSSTSSTLPPLFSSFTAAGATSGFSFSNITKSYGIDAVLTAAESHNLAKVLSRPRVVTQNNVKAQIKQGLKIPVMTAGTANANASVSYIDAVLRLDVTPQITADGTIFMNVDVENTQPDGTSNGNYILSTQAINTQVLVNDGGTIVIGGVIQTTNSVSVSQTPILGSIPLLGNLFKERLVKTETDELIFFITPKIIQS
jgi:type IV pilus assembly protein PilQ